MRIRQVLGLILVSVPLLAVSAAKVDTGGQASGAIVVRNAYWAREGMVEEVYRHRVHASDVRAGLGLYRGRVLRRVGDVEGEPDVVWECEYPSPAAREADLRALSESGAFEPVLEKMGTLIEKFQRTVWRVESDAN